MQRFTKILLTPLAFVFLCLGSPAGVRADTVNFTFTFDAIIVSDPPVPPTSTVNSVLTAIGFVNPFGAATDTEVGTTTFITWPGGIFAPASVSANFTFSFNDGADTFFGTDTVVFDAPGPGGLSNTHSYTILGGTGIFSGASGSATATGFTVPPPPGQLPRETFSGSGTITASGLTAVPEPMTVLLLGTGLAGLGAAVRKRRKTEE